MTRPFPASTARAASSLSRHWIFGYGSLAHVEDLTRYLAGYDLGLGKHSFETLSGFRRTWSVAMDNANTTPGYKYFVDPSTGERPAYVAFANIERAGQSSVTGILFEACERTLEVFDRRERNYHRTDVTAQVAAPVDGTVWTYIGTPEAHARYHHGVRTNTLVLDRAYVEIIASAFDRAKLEYTADLPHNVPIVDLTRVDI